MTRFRCFSCGRFTNEVAEGPLPDDVGQALRWMTGVLDVHASRANLTGCRAAVACWNCFWKTDPDMWISAACWNELRPLIPFEKLPLMLDMDTEKRTHEDPAMYPWPE